MIDDLVSVIVPVYNSEKYLRDCIDSIVNQTYKNLDIILIDDGSTDYSGIICDEYAEKDNRVRVIHKENGGNGDARNVGLEAVKGQWIVMSDNDDILHKKQIEVLLTAVCEKDADICVGWYRAFEIGERLCDEDVPDNFINSVEILSDRHLFDDEFLAKYSMILTVPWCKICKSTLYNGIKYPKKSRHDDTWTTWKIYENAKKALFIPIVLHYWRNDPNSFGRRQFDTTHFEGIDAYREQLEYFHSKDRQRYVEITFASYLEMFFWCYNRMKESGMDVSLLNPYWEYMKKSVRYIRFTKSLGGKQWIRYRYLVWYKIPKLIMNK